jgi:protein-disulfide isomerase-like protein with CxxC motif
MRDETRLDFTSAQSLGVSGFPTLGVAYGPQLFLVTSGYVTADVLEERLVEIDRLARERALAKSA